MHKINKIGIYKEVTVKIYLMKGNTHYFVDKLIDSSNSIIFTTLLEDNANANFIDPFYLRAFDRVSATVTFTPAYLNQDGCISSLLCFDIDEKATVYFKSHHLTFFITKEMTIENIIFDGADMFPYVYGVNNTLKLSSHLYYANVSCTCTEEAICTSTDDLYPC